MFLRIILFILLSVSIWPSLEHFEGTNLYLYRIRHGKSRQFLEIMLKELIEANSSLKGKIELKDSKEPDLIIFRLENQDLQRPLRAYLEKLDHSKNSFKSAIIKLQYTDAPMVALYLQKIFGLYSEQVMPSGKTASSTSYNQEIKVVSDAASNSIVLEGPHFQVEDAKRLIQSIDTRTPQVLIEVLISEVTLNHDESLGIEWEVLGKGLGGQNVSNTATIDYGTVSSNPTAANSRNNLRGLKLSILNPGNFETFLQSVKQSNKVRVLSRPKILTTNNKAANFKATQRNPVLKVTNADGVVNNSVEYLDIGIELDVTPRINKDNYIFLDIVQTIQEIIGTDPAALNSPIYSERRVLSSVLVKDNHTIILGGIISSSKVEGESRVPVLGSLPLLKKIFRRKTRDHKKTEMVVFITPHVIRDYNLADEVTKIQSSNLRDPEPIVTFIQEGEDYRKSLTDQESILGSVMHVEDEGSKVLVHFDHQDLAKTGSTYVIVRPDKSLFDDSTHQFIGRDLDYVATVTLVGKADQNLFHAQVQEQDNFRKEVLVGDLVKRQSTSFLDSNVKQRVNMGSARVYIESIPKDTRVDVVFEVENIDKREMTEILISDGVLTSKSSFFVEESQHKLNYQEITSTSDKSSARRYQIKLIPSVKPGEKIRLGYSTPLPSKWVETMIKEKRFKLNSSNSQDFTYDVYVSNQVKILKVNPPPVAELSEPGYRIFRYFKPKEKVFQKVELGVDFQ